MIKLALCCAAAERLGCGMNARKELRRFAPPRDAVCHGCFFVAAGRGFFLVRFDALWDGRGKGIEWLRHGAPCMLDQVLKVVGCVALHHSCGCCDGYCCLVFIPQSSAL